MSRLLYIESSPRKERSASIEVAQAFLKAYLKSNPNADVDTLDVWSEDLPEFNNAALEAKYAGIAGESLTKEQQTAWDSIRAFANRFHRADKILLGVPMWNFGIPYKLKQLIDVVSQKDLLFTFDDNGLQGMLTNHKAAVIYARGLEYSDDSPIVTPEWDQQKPYTEIWLKSIGITDVTSIIVNNKLLGADSSEALSEASALGSRF